MATQVYTETTCDHCGATKRREGPHNTMPAEWASIRVRIIKQPLGDVKWLEAELCWRCWVAVEPLLRRKARP